MDENSQNQFEKWNCMEKMRESLVHNQGCYNVKIIKSYWVDAGIERRET